MAIATLDQLLAASLQRLDFQKTAWVPSTGIWKDGGVVAGNPAPYGTPAGARTFNNGDLGTIPFSTPPAGQGSFLSGLRVGAAATNVAMLVDRLCDWGGADGTSVAVQNTPTPALPRYTTGDDVEAWIEVFAQTGGTFVGITVNYTNSNGVAGVGSSIVNLPVNSPVGTMIPVTLAPGDTGVRSIQSIQLSASTGVVGNLGVALLRRLVAVASPVGVSERPFFERDWMAVGMPQLPDTAALVPMLAPGGSSSGAVTGEFDVVQG